MPTQTNEHSHTQRPQRVTIDVLVIGAGFSGVYALHKLRKLGLNVKLYETGSDYGGSWYWNRYPGAAVDSEIPLYQFSDYDTYCSWYWKDRFPGHEEIRAYFKHVATVWDLRKDTFFNTTVTRASFDGHRWVAETDDGRVTVAKYLIAATGSSNKRYLPAFPGLENYRGQVLHSSRYPENTDITGKRVAVIGNGASGVQIIQTLAKQDCHLTAFIRAPAVNLPMNQRHPSILEQNACKGFIDSLHACSKRTGSGFPYSNMTASFYDFTPEERTTIFEELWSRGGFAYFMSTFPEFAYDIEVNKITYDFWVKKTAHRIRDPVKREIVCPTTQPYWLGTKRSNLEQDYYESVDRPNVELVNVKASPIQQFTAEGIRTEDGVLREFDIVVLATGYDNVTGSLMDLNLKDKDGNQLKQKWKEGVYTYLGLCIPGMPNLFMIYSPQSPSQLSNGPPIIEIQGDWIYDAIKKMMNEEIDTIEGQDASSRQWREDIQDMNAKSLFPQTDSWYTGANIPGKVREQLVYLGGVSRYREIIQDSLDGWKGFNVRTTKMKGNTVAF